MAQETVHEIEAGLQETRKNLARWMETTPSEKKAVECCVEGEASVVEHLRVIDQSLEKIASGAFGICEVCHDPVDAELLRMDYTSTVCLGHFSEQELRELESELSLSQIVQRGLLPQEAPKIPGLSIAAFSRPAQIVSGDYFDFVQFQDGGHGVVMADVSGHGVSAGMLMSSLQTAIHTLVPSADSPLEVLEKINGLYAHNIKFTTFVTVFFGKYDPNTHSFTYANAGHNAGYLYRPSTGEEKLLHATGPAIGLMESFMGRAEQIDLLPSDVLVLYTDGVTEAMNPSNVQWGLDGLVGAIRPNCELPAEQLVTQTLQALTMHTEGAVLADDATLVIAKVT